METFWYSVLCKSDLSPVRIIEHLKLLNLQFSYQYLNQSLIIKSSTDTSKQILMFRTDIDTFIDFSDL